MVTAIQLSDFATTPLYNIKAVVQATNISPSTLRAWERRYNMCQPERSESGYRLYSDRDIAVIRWLKAQVDAGMSISQAVTWLRNLTDEASDGGTPATLPDRNGRALENVPSLISTSLEIQNFGVLQSQLLEGLLHYDEASAERILAGAFALYPVEHVGEQVIMPVMIEIGERWHRGEVSITREHYASNYLLQRLAAILRTVPNAGAGPMIWIGCAPGEQHEIGSMLLSIYLRRAGYQVRYLGQDLPDDDLVKELNAQQPALVLFSATGSEAAQNLKRLCDKVAELEPPRPMIGYGGRAFNLHPELRNTLTGIFLGATALEGVESIEELLAEKPRLNKRHERVV